MNYCVLWGMALIFLGSKCPLVPKISFGESLLLVFGELFLLVFIVETFFSRRKKLALVILIKNQTTSILPSQKWVTIQKNTAHKSINLLETLPGGKAI